MIYANQFNIPTINRPYIWILWDMACRNINFFYSMETSNEQLDKLRYCSSNAFRIITANQSGTLDIAKYLIFPEERIKSIPFPAQDDLKLAKETQPKKKYSNYIFYPALLTSLKNHVVILKALRILHDQNITLNLVLTGADRDGLAHILQAANELNVQRFIHYLGVVPIEELKWIYKNADALVFPTLLGPNNFPPIEAMSLGVPVIVSDIIGHRNQLQENALFFDPLCPESLASQIKRLVGDPTLRKKLINSGSRFVESLSPDNYLTELLECADEFAPYLSTYR
jgi:glycosyltransferase involved in cell wall biosynthesis